MKVSSKAILNIINTAIFFCNTIICILYYIAGYAKPWHDIRGYVLAGISILIGIAIPILYKIILRKDILIQTSITASLLIVLPLLLGYTIYAIKTKVIQYSDWASFIFFTVDLVTVLIYGSFSFLISYLASKFLIKN